MKKIFVCLLLAFLTTNISAQTKYELKNNTFVVSVQQKQDIKTGYKIQIKDKTYDIYQSKNGKYYILRKSNKTGKEYKQYLKETDIVNILNTKR